MATQYNKIEKPNFNTKWAQTWSDSHGNKDQKRYVYVCAPAWIAEMRTSYNLFGSGVVQFYASYWNGTAWSSEGHVETSGGDNKKVSHNRDEANLHITVHNGYPLWRIRYWPSKANTRWNINLYAGGWGVSTTNYPTGQLIKSRGRAGTTTLIHADGTTNNPDNVVNNIFNWRNRTGSPILASDDSELVYYPY